MSVVDNVVAIDASKRFFGQVKWFNTKAGYGFITVCKDGSALENKDIFVHYSALRLTNPQYKYLVQGEYIEFSVVKPESDKYEYHAADVSGILGGNIMCETKRVVSSAMASAHAEYKHRPPRTPVETEDGFEKVVSKKQRNMNLTITIPK